MTYDENEEYNGPDTKRRGPFLFMAAIVGVILVAGFGAAASEVRADEQPFTVTAEGVTLPDGQTFPDGGHVNIQATGPHNDLHFEAKCIDRVVAECATLHDAAQFIGKSFIPWSAFGLSEGDCISWVQVAGIPKHFGDAGEAPICLGGTPSTTDPTPSSTPSETPTPTSTPVPTSRPSSEPPATGVSLPPKSGGPEPATTDSMKLTPSPSSTSGAVVPDRLADTGMDATLGLVVFAVIVFAAGLSILLGRRAGLERFGSES
jgi:hypothetical protein